jgi:hypothetical protein
MLNEMPAPILSGESRLSADKAGFAGKNLYLCYLLIIGFLISSNSFAQYQNIRIDGPQSWQPEEVTIAINPLNPNIIAAAANIDHFYLSTNGGLNWSESHLSSMLGVWGDPALLFDSLGNLYYAHLSNPVSGYWIDRIVVQKSTNNGLTWNDGAGVGFFAPKNQDKEWLTVDLTQSPNSGNIYMTWTEFDNYGSPTGSDSSRIRFSKSTNEGITWGPAVTISDVSGDCIDSDNTDEGAVPCVGPDGEIYVSWAGPLGLVFDKSTDGGITWGNDIFVSDIPGGWDFDVPGIYRANGLPITMCNISNSPNRGTIYIVWSDQRNGTSNTDIFLVKSTDKGNTWSLPVKVNNDATTRHQFFVWSTIDQSTGHLWFVFYDRRNTATTETDVFAAKSIDGGVTFDNFKISETSFTPTSGVFFGDYTNIAAFKEKIYPIWMRLQGGQLSIWTTMIEDEIVPVELTHFSANVINNTVELDWETSTETNNQGFEIERLQNYKISRLQDLDPKSEIRNPEWVTIGFVKGKGTSTEINKYRFVDNPSLNGIYTYRLKQVDFDGTFKYSKKVEVNVMVIVDFALMQNYPNPFNPSTVISYRLPVISKVSLKVYDVLGNEVATLVDEEKPAGEYEVTWEAKNLAGGVYFYRLQTEEFIQTKNMLMIK